MNSRVEEFLKDNVDIVAQSRAEAILKGNVDIVAQSRIEKLLIELIKNNNSNSSSRKILFNGQTSSIDTDYELINEIKIGDILLFTLKIDTASVYYYNILVEVVDFNDKIFYKRDLFNSYYLTISFRDNKHFRLVNISKLTCITKVEKL